MPLVLKLETKSSPVRGISFHHKRPWVIASLENGIIQHWDYKISAILWQFEGHVGAVRGICFHSANPIFVSGGDDKILKVWNVEDRKCISILWGHSEIIRSCSFHRKFPWIISSSNDKTVRIWNWNIKQCVAKLTGHEMAVTGAIFHPTSSVVFSSSKDGSIRLWDISKLENYEGTGADQIWSILCSSAIYTKNVDPNMKGLNHVAFNEERSYVITGTDEKNIILFKYTEEKENKKLLNLGSYEGHDNIVNSVAFHPCYSILIGCSDDKSIRIWSVASKECIDILRYQNERFGVLAAHPRSCLFAAGHENGMILFKNRRERPVICVNDGFAYYLCEQDSIWLAEPIVKEKDGKENRNSMKNLELRRMDLRTNNDVCIHILDANIYSEVRASLSFNSSKDYFIFTSSSYDRKTCNFQLHRLHSESDGDCNSDCTKGSGRRAFWIARNQFAVLNDSRTIEIRDLSNAIICDLGLIADDIFYAGTGIILLKIDYTFFLFDIEKRIVISSVKSKAEIRFVVWSKSKEYVAFLAKKKLFLLNRKFEILYVQEESNNLKSGCWMDESVFVYNTKYQFKYALTIGDSGIIKTLDFDKRLYIFSANGVTLYCCDRDTHIYEFDINSSEYKLKLAIFHGRIDEAVRLLTSKRAKFAGQSMTAALMKYGYSDIALNFVKDDRTRFSLALELGNLEKALDSAERLDEDIAWTTLAEAALFQGNHKIAEICYKKTDNYEKLSFLYFVTGNTAKLKELMKVIDAPNVLFQVALLIGDIGERIRILKRCDQISLAYLTAATHGYDNEVDELKKELEFKKRPIPKIFSNARFLTPLRPVHLLMESWPVANFEGSLDEAGLRTSKTCEKMCDAMAPVEERIEKELERRIEEKVEKRIEVKLEENSKEDYDYGELLDYESDNVSLGGERDRESPTLPNSPGSNNKAE